MNCVARIIDHSDMISAVEGGCNLFRIYELRHEKNRSSGFPTRSDTNRSVQPQKMATSLKFWIEEEEELNYLCSENKGADQLCSICEADLRLCFCIC